MVDGAQRGLAVVGAGCGAALVGTFLPWIRSGAKPRSSYEIFDLVERLGFASNGVVSWSLRLWPLVPLVLVGTVLAAWGVAARRLPVVALVSVMAPAALWVGGTALAVALAPDAGLFRVGPGPWLTVLGVSGGLVGAVLVSRRESGSSAAS